MERLGFEERLRRSQRGPDECWIWQGALSRHGYGVFRRERRLEYAHRATYELLVGPVPDGFELDHRCATPACCNPQHLEPVSHAVNMARYGERRTHCKNGHLLASVGFYHRPDGRRECQACRDKQVKAWNDAHPYRLRDR